MMNVEPKPYEYNPYPDLPNCEVHTTVDIVNMLTEEAESISDMAAITAQGTRECDDKLGRRDKRNEFAPERIRPGTNPGGHESALVPFRLVAMKIEAGFRAWIKPVALFLHYQSRSAAAQERQAAALERQAACMEETLSLHKSARFKGAAKE